MKKMLFAFQLAALAVSAGPSLAEPITSPSRITSVTVFPDRAIVTRTLSLDVKTGSHELNIDGLPMGLLEDSVRVSGKGKASAKIAGLELRKTFLKEGEDARVKAIEK